MTTSPTPPNTPKEVEQVACCAHNRVFRSTESAGDEMMQVPSRSVRLDLVSPTTQHPRCIHRVVTHRQEATGDFLLEWPSLTPPDDGWLDGLCRTLASGARLVLIRGMSRPRTLRDQVVEGVGRLWGLEHATTPWRAYHRSLLSCTPRTWRGFYGEMTWQAYRQHCSIVSVKYRGAQDGWGSRA